jgi:hypothetical protein
VAQGEGPVFLSPSTAKTKQKPKKQKATSPFIFLI